MVHQDVIDERRDESLVLFGLVLVGDVEWSVDLGVAVDGVDRDGGDDVPVFGNLVVGVGVEHVGGEPPRFAVVEILVDLCEHEAAVDDRAYNPDIACRGALDEGLKNATNPSTPSATPVLCWV
jgi:hypothetical protein